MLHKISCPSLEKICISFIEVNCLKLTSSFETERSPAYKKIPMNGMGKFSLNLNIKTQQNMKIA